MAPGRVPHARHATRNAFLSRILYRAAIDCRSRRPRGVVMPLL
jgi:hypothetical protein